MVVYEKVNHKFEQKLGKSVCAHIQVDQIITQRKRIFGEALQNLVNFTIKIGHPFVHNVRLVEYASYVVGLYDDDLDLMDNRKLRKMSLPEKCSTYISTLHKSCIMTLNFGHDQIVECIRCGEEK